MKLPGWWNWVEVPRFYTHYALPPSHSLTDWAHLHALRSIHKHLCCCRRPKLPRFWSTCPPIPCDSVWLRWCRLPPYNHPSIHYRYFSLRPKPRTGPHILMFPIHITSVTEDLRCRSGSLDALVLLRKCGDSGISVWIPWCVRSSNPKPKSCSLKIYASEVTILHCITFFNSNSV
jgi:hypothetical protein